MIPRVGEGREGRGRGKGERGRGKGGRGEGITLACIKSNFSNPKMWLCGVGGSTSGGLGWRHGAAGWGGLGWAGLGWLGWAGLGGGVRDGMRLVGAWELEALWLGGGVLGRDFVLEFGLGRGHVSLAVCG